LDLLIASVPELRRGWLEEVGRTEMASAGAPALAAAPHGCSFFDRCAARMAGVCDLRAPPPRRLSKGADILCHRTEQELDEIQSPAQTVPGGDSSSPWRAQQGAR
jgi:peptide/nickel transport system ATP-binding protein